MKPFSQELYDVDDNAKLLVLSWLHKYQPELNWRVNPDDYGIDLVSDSTWTVEVEVKHHWKGATFPFSTVHIPGRKIKFITDDAFFVVVNDDRTHALVIDSASMAAAHTVWINNKFVELERFIEIPLFECLTINLTSGTDTINNLGNEKAYTK